MVLSRNERCSCGSGFKFKHCCGAFSAEAAKPSSDELELLAIEADDAGLQLGEEPNQRAFANVLRMLQRLGVDGVALTGPNALPIVKRVHAANDRLFRTRDKREGGIHLGFFMFRDLFSRLYVPLIFGNPPIDFVTLVDLSDDQKKWLYSDDEAWLRFEDQALDLFDFGYGYFEFGHSRTVPDEGKELIYRSHIHLEAAAATATSAYDFRGTVQSALIGTELALKAGLACHGVDDTKLRRTYGHNLVKAACGLGDLEPGFDLERAVRAVSSFPDFAQSRYSGAQLTRLETGHILMKAQFVASEVTRTFTERNLRKNEGSIRPRSYPE
jgi:hypothetical protein